MSHNMREGVWREARKTRGDTTDARGEGGTARKGREKEGEENHGTESGRSSSVEHSRARHRRRRLGMGLRFVQALPVARNLEAPASHTCTADVTYPQLLTEDDLGLRLAAAQCCCRCWRCATEAQVQDLASPVYR